MTEPDLPALLIIANSPGTLTHLCGISLLERLLRTVRRLGFRDAIVLSNSVKSLAAHDTNSFRKDADVSLRFCEQSGTEPTISDIRDCLETNNVSSADRILLVFAGFYCDARLLRVLMQAQTSSALIDSRPPSFVEPLWRNLDVKPCAALISNDWLSKKNRASAVGETIAVELTAGGISSVDAAQQPVYVPDMRRNIRPVFFPAPSPELRPVAERLLRDTTQKGVLDFPALVHAPVEKWIVSHLCHTSITPNQVTLGTGIIGLCVTLLYSFGYLWAGALLALAVGILDGVDGKLARLSVQTSKTGKGEHVLDYFVEMSWWTALAHHFYSTRQVPYAYAMLLLFFVFDLLERLARWFVSKQLGRGLDDVSRFDRLVRYVAGRRNIYTWLFTFTLLIGAPATGFIWLCSWGIASAAIHIFRAAQIRFAE